MRKTGAKMQPNGTSTESIEDVLFTRMGVTVADALATGTDAIDETISKSVEHGIDVNSRLSGLVGLLTQLTEPKNLQALSTLVSLLPQLAELAKVSQQIPGMIAAIGDVFDEFQEQCATDGINLEASLTQSLQAVLRLGSQLDTDKIELLSRLMQSDILNSDTITAATAAATALKSCQQEAGPTEKVGLFGLLGLLRDPDIQHAVGFASKFGKKFGKQIETHK